MTEEAKPKSTDGGMDDTASYSASKAPETQAEMGGRDSTGDPRLIPGGLHGAPHDVGMSGMERDDVPSRAEKPEQLNMRDSPKGVE